MCEKPIIDILIRIHCLVHVHIKCMKKMLLSMEWTVFYRVIVTEID